MGGGIITRAIIKKFEIEYIQVMDEEGNVDESLHPDVDEDTKKVMYHMMMLVRAFDEKLFKLQRSGKIGTYAQVRGQEASEIGSGMALQKKDWFIPSFREMGVSLVRGADRAKIVEAWRGDTHAFQGAREETRDLPVAIPIASQLLHAVGLAWASKLKGEKQAAIVYFGDGATSEGDFHEALNFAAELQLPVVFFCQNNQWAISTPRKSQTRAETIAQKAIAYGMPSVQIDGNDVIGVYKVTSDALVKAREGGGPTLIESLTFRMGDHTTSDDSSKYRDEEEVKKWELKDPILRLQKHFEKLGTWSEEYRKFVVDEVQKEVEDAVEKGLAIPPPSPEEMFDSLYENPPEIFLKEKDAFMAELQERKGLGGDAQ
ncbi:MAG: pyruvate dehydrogenase (acetyl-transferring) E1 component subunit alpha [archaeon]